MTDKKHAPTVAAVGCGYWGKNLVRNFAEFGALVAICDADTNTARKLAAQHKIPARTWPDILADRSVDALAIAAPAVQHESLAREALLAGKHVFVEKPLALTLGDARALSKLADECGRVLMVGHLLQYHPAFLKLKDMVARGELGRLQYVYSNRLNLGKIRREENSLWSFAPHDISMILSLIGEEPNRVAATGGSFLHKGVADVTSTHLSFPGGAQAHVFVSWLHPFKEQKLVIVGDAGMAVFDDGEPWERKLQLYRQPIVWDADRPEPIKTPPQFVPVEQAEPLRVECQHFLDCVATGTRPRTDGEEGVRVLRVLEEAQRSMDQQEMTKRQEQRFPGTFVHESAYVDDDVEIAADSKIWHFSHLLPRVRIGRRCVIGQNVSIGPDVTVGDNCKIQNNVSLYKGVKLEDGVFCGPSCVFTNVMNPRAEIERKSEFRSTLVRRGATIGANATIVCGATLGAYCFVGAGAVVTHDVPDFALVVGVPARRVGWMSRAGAQLGSDLVCPIDGSRYREASPDRLEPVE